MKHTCKKENVALASNSRDIQFVEGQPWPKLRHLGRSCKARKLVRPCRAGTCRLWSQAARASPDTLQVQKLLPLPSHCDAEGHLRKEDRGQKGAQETQLFLDPRHSQGASVERIMHLMGNV